jgi:hypothetical protein
MKCKLAEAGVQQLSTEKEEQTLLLQELESKLSSVLEDYSKRVYLTLFKNY